MEKFEMVTEASPYQHSEANFERVFKTYFKALYAYAFSFVKDRDIAEDMVQSVFCKLWEKSGEVNIQSSISAYLYRSVYYECLNHLKHQKVKLVHESHARLDPEQDAEGTSDRLALRELQSKLTQTLKELPEGCRTIFQLSRFESLKYQEIADKLGISIKTVENQMGKALKILRMKLVDFLPLLLAFFFSGL